MRKDYVSQDSCTLSLTIFNHRLKIFHLVNLEINLSNNHLSTLYHTV